LNKIKDKSKKIKVEKGVEEVDGNSTVLLCEKLCVTPWLIKQEDEENRKRDI